MLLKKLYKYELKALFRYLLPVWISVVALACVNKISLELITKNIASKMEENYRLSTTLLALAGTINALFYLGIYASAIICFIIIAVRFYKNLYSSEGYFTMTMPFTAGNQLWCKLVCAFIMCLITGCVAFLALVIVSVNNDALPVIIESIKNSIDNLSRPENIGHSIALGIELPILGVLSLAAGLLMAYASISLGQRFKNRVGSAVGIYLGFSAGNSILLSIIFSILAVCMASLSNNPEAGSFMIHVFIWVGIIYSAGISAAFFVISYRSLKFNYNLE